jgi:predicted transcriptional regulator
MRIFPNNSHIDTLFYCLYDKKERIRELRVRQENGVLSESARSRMAEIKDEIEALETEIKVVESRIAQEGSIVVIGSESSSSGTVGVETAEPRAAARQLEVLRNHLLADLQRLDESSAIRLLLVMVNDAVETKFRLEQEGKSLAALKAQLQEVETARDELVRVIQKNNLDYSSKIDSLKSENETKVSYLLQQLRVLEDRVKQMPSSKGSLSPGKKVKQAEELTSAIATSLSSRPSSASPSPVSVWASVVGRRSQSTPRDSEDAVNVSSDSLVSAFQQPRGGGARPGTAPYHASTSSTVRPQSAASAATEPGDRINSDDELQRKWLAERQRREQLEKRNVELARELRTLRSGNDKNSGVN